MTSPGTDAAAAPAGSARPFPAIGDYGLIGDCGSAALVARDGAIEWLCWPRFDSPALFARILDRERGGVFAVGPSGPARTRRAYVEHTNVLETVFETDRGVLRLRDAMVAAPRDTHQGCLWPEHQILRELVCLEGEVEAEVRCEPRFGYGARPARCEPRGAHGVVFQDRGLVTVFRSEIPVETRNACVLEGRARLRAGERRFVSLSVDSSEPATLPPLGGTAADKLDKTLAFWRSWAGRCDYEGPYRDAVVRSALVLKLLTISTSGAIVAAPTASLPEEVGGVRNWDYRYCWLRDASFTLRALLELGYAHEGSAFLSWLLHTTRQTAPHLNVMYDVFGSTEIDEEELGHLEGYRGSRPVRVGNGASGQLQLDLYGTLVDAVVEYVARGGQLGSWQRRLLERLARAVSDEWDQPDNGIWEIRTQRRRHTLSAAMCWVAADGLRAMEEDGLIRLDRERLDATRHRIREAVLRHGVGPDGAFRSTLDEDGGVDAALLLLDLYGFEESDSPRMRRTFEVVRERLGRGVLLHRYPPDWDDGLPPGEGAFGLCSLWAVQHLARVGRVKEAREELDAFLGYANDLGLFSEEIDSDTGELLGNFPQAFTHAGVINAALAIAEAEGARGRRRMEPEIARAGRDPHGRAAFPEAQEDGT